jgi:hypothetical protein
MFKFFCCFIDDKNIKNKTKLSRNNIKNTIQTKLEIKEKSNSDDDLSDNLSDDFTILDTTIIKIKPSIFKNIGQIGDFNWEIINNIEPNTLYIFNDNEIHHETDIIGGGNAIIRQYNKYGYKNHGYIKPRSAGICTGKFNSGYKILNYNNKKIIDSCINSIKLTIKKYGYDTIKYSSKNSEGELGTGMFNVADDVKKYIIEQINKLP